MPEELTVREAADRHGVTVSWLIRNLDQIQYRQIGPMYLVDADSVAAWAANRKRRGGSAKGVPWSHQKRQQEQNTHQPAAPPVGPPAAPTPPAPVIHAPIETRAEGAQIRIDALQPVGDHWMRAEARAGDIEAWIDIRPCNEARYPGGYVLDYSSGRADHSKKGKMGRNQEERAQALMHQLGTRVAEALEAQGWQPLAKTATGKTIWHYQPGQQKEGTE